jgi:hypothetical protein
MAEHKPVRLEEYRPRRRARDDYDAPTGEENAGQGDVAEDADADYGGSAPDLASASAEPDVLLDVPVLKVEEIHLEVEDLNARVSLQAEVLSLLKLHVGADVSLGRVALDIKGVEAVAQLKVRLDQVAAIIDGVMTTIDNNPQILTDLTRGLGAAAGEVGRGAGHAVGEVGRGAGEAAGEVGRGAGQALEEVGGGAGSAVESVGDDVGEAVGDIGQTGGRVVEGVVEDSEDIGDEVLRSGLEATGSEAGRARQRPAERADASGEADRPRRRPPPSEDRPRRVRRQRPPAEESSPHRDKEARRARRPRPE